MHPLQGWSGSRKGAKHGQPQVQNIPTGKESRMEQYESRCRLKFEASALSRGALRACVSPCRLCYEIERLLYFT